MCKRMFEFNIVKLIILQNRRVVKRFCQRLGGLTFLTFQRIINGPEIGAS